MRALKILTLNFLLLTLITGCQPTNNIDLDLSTIPSTMQITSPAFTHQASIPEKYTCQGDNINPPLNFTDVPTKTKSLVLILDDPDAPGGDFVHWLLWNIDPTTPGIDEKSSPQSAVSGTTGFGSNLYGGPCPPSGNHRYFFKLYALDITLDLPASTDKSGLLAAMNGHIIDQAELIGTYEKK
jgi:Raf kinase inhibitor-like YbhB/YbcL family protein